MFECAGGNTVRDVGHSDVRLGEVRVVSIPGDLGALLSPVRIHLAKGFQEAAPTHNSQVLIPDLQPTFISTLIATDYFLPLGRTCRRPFHYDDLSALVRAWPIRVPDS